ncbi:hypothetical protein PAXINDRAFT_80119, partial [Paxillus involutus ATCC 200175]
LAMPCREYRAFLLNHSLHTSFVQVLADSIWVRMLLGMKYRDCGNIETSGLGYSMSRTTKIKPGEDSVLLDG